MNSFLNELDWSEIVRTASFDIDGAYNSFQANYSAAVDRYVPVSKSRPQSSRIDRAIKSNKAVKAAMKLKFSSFAKFLATSPKSPDYQQIANLKNKAARAVKKTVELVRAELEDEILLKCKTEPKLMYSFINEQRKCKTSIRTLITPEGLSVVKREQIANCLNNHFKRAFTSGSRTCELPFFEDRTSLTCEFNPYVSLSACNVEKRLEKLNKRKSIGVDGIHPYVLRECASSLSKIVSALFIASFLTGQIPESWKKANITPVYKKKGRKDDPGNYRPVALLAITLKVMEGCVRDEMLFFLVTNNLIGPSQHGFVNGKSCVTNLLEALDIITETMNRCFMIILVLLDLAKAFDKVPHDELIFKLKKYGFRGELVVWLECFLRDRKQRVVLGEYSSDWVDVDSGVPQGSVLGPLLFIIFINDMPELLNHLCKLYADDSKLIGIIKNQLDINSLQADIDALVDWSTTWRMSFSPEKCKTMRFCKKNHPMNNTILRMKDGDISRDLVNVKSEKDLGVTLSDDLKWDEHVRLIKNKANGLLGTLRKSFRNWNTRAFKVLFISYVRPLLEYASPVWNPMTKKNIKCLEQVQRRATKSIKGFNNLSYSERLSKLGIDTLEARRRRGDLIQMFKLERNYNRITWYQPNSIDLTRVCGLFEVWVS